MIKIVPGIGRETSWNVSALEETFMKKERKIQFVLTLDNVIVNATYVAWSHHKKRVFTEQTPWRQSTLLISSTFTH